jgi:serine/threonine-protein kinase
MSRVFLGERGDGAFAQRVAIKVLRAGLDTAHDIERFRSERQILASLDHPNIARLLDGGVAPDGRPYLVLEYIEGEPLTAYSDAHRLDVEARLRLFLSVAEATQSAHRQLVVHRDLKPSNILVGADGRPRLLDFGVAKILDPGQVEPGGGATATRRRWMTPEYAAPEQFAGAPVTTATDVWQLGAVLYELLSGHRPFEPRPGDRTPLEVRLLRDDPPAPSSYAAALRGDLDAVVLKALRKEPGARYASVAELAADVQRFLDGEPVAARAGERAYRWRRLARRRALPLSLAAAGVVIAAGYVGTLSVKNRRIAQALETANVEREKAQQITGFLLGLFNASDPRHSTGDTITARTLLARGEERANALERQPEVQAELLDIIARIRSDLGSFAEARPNLERALAIRRRLLGDSHPDVVQTIANVAELARASGRHDDAERGFRQALALQRATIGDTAGPTQMTLFYLGSLLHQTGRHREAAPVLREWEGLVTRNPPRRDSVYAFQLGQLGQWVEMGARGDTAALARAEWHYRESLAIKREIYGPRHADVGFITQAIGGVAAQRGRTAEADSLFREGIGIIRAAFPDGHPTLAATLVGYGRSLMAQNRNAEALPLFREAVDISRRYHTDNVVMVASYVGAYGDALRRSGDYAAAVPALREALGGFRRQMGERSVMAGRTRVQLGDALRGLGRTREAESELLAAYAQFSGERGARDAQTQFALRELVKLYEGAGRQADATRYRALISTAPGAGRAASAVH